MTLSFAQICEQRQLNSAEIVLEWLKTHKCVASRALAVEVDYRYSESAFRMCLWRMVRSGEVVPTDYQGVYLRGEIKPHRAKDMDETLREEIGMVAQYMPREQVASLYQVALWTVRNCKDAYKRSHTSRA